MAPLVDPRELRTVALPPVERLTHGRLKARFLLSRDGNGRFLPVGNASGKP